MEEIILKKELEEIGQLEGKVRGVAIKHNVEFILKEEGEEGLEKLKKEMSKIGYPLEYEKIKPLNFYPISLEAALLITAQKLFDYSEDKIQEMGSFGSKSSFIVRLFSKYFFSPEKSIKHGKRMWKSYFSKGDLEIKDFDPDKKHITILLKNFKLHPLHCQLLIGFFKSLLKMMVKAEVSCQEKKCIFSGDDYHEFFAEW